MHRLLLFTVFVFLAVSTFAHGDLHEKINRLTAQIEKDPENVKLYLSRGQTYFHHEEYNKALTDYHKVLQLDEEIFVAHLLISETYLATESYENGIDAINQYLYYQPNDAAGYQINGRLHLLHNEYEQAAICFDKAIELAPKYRSQHFVEAAGAWVNAGQPMNAISQLKAGINEMGFIITLYDELIAISNQAGEYTIALNAVDEVLDRLNRNEKWLLEKGKILAQMGQNEEAARYCDKALTAINTLPTSIKNTPAIQNIRKETLHLKSEL